MKRFYSTIALALCLALMFSAYLPDAARAGSEPFLGVYRPDVAQTGGTAIAGSEQIQKLIELDATLDGEPVRVELSFALAAEPKDAVWTELAGRLTQSAAARVTYATGQTAGQIGQAIRDVVDAMLDEDAQASLGGAIALTSVKVTLPYYADLTRGASGDAVTRLQQRLIQLGFLEGTADGQFGGGTEAGVLALENYIRALEQAEIDANATPTPAPTPEPTPAPTPDPSATDAADADAPEIEATPEPTPEPAPTPQTPADGVAEAAL
ncbi:MAG: peptidoglycan-binding protein, partial [Clostridiales bacterium]|nr:peptidoglycan-binding protein [Clostridiales bacterium]